MHSGSSLFQGVERETNATIVGGGKIILALPIGQGKRPPSDTVLSKKMLSETQLDAIISV
jgi:hypothetical protein